MAHIRLSPLAYLAILAAGFVVNGAAYGGTYFFAGEEFGVDLVTHPELYTGAGGTIEVKVCIVLGSPNASLIQIPVKNAVDRYNLMVPTVGNLRSGSDNAMTNSQYDFESVLTHELGHCLGMDHVNLASESGLADPDANSTKSTDGFDNVFNVNSGFDGVVGSADDIRGDDFNLHWFFVGENNPFELPATPGAGTYSRASSDLPSGDNFAANADRDLATLFGLPATEAVMQQGTYNDEDQRSLSADDVATLNHARAGVDRVVGTSDDYTVYMTYGGISNASSCNINVSFNDGETGFAACQLGGSSINSSNIRITSADAYFNTTSVKWFFSSRRIPLPTTESITVGQGASTSVLDSGGNSLLSNDIDQQGSGLLLSNSSFFGPQNGSVLLNANGTFSYTHDGGSSESDRFVYRVCVNNGFGQETNACSHQWVSVTVGNTTPLAVDDGPGGVFSVDEGLGVTLLADQLTVNDTDAEDGIPNGAVSLAGVVSNGLVVDNGNQSFTFTQDGSETATASFQYTVADSENQTSNIATVNLSTNNSNDSPVANDDGPGGDFIVLEGLTVALPSFKFTGNDTDEEDLIPGGAVTIAGATSNGSAVYLGNNYFAFTHDGTETSDGSFQYQVLDTDGASSNLATVRFSVINSNDSPVANDDTGLVGLEGQSLMIPVSTLKANDTDEEDGTPLGAVTLVGETINGVVSNSAGVVTFTHDGSQTSSGSFQYQVMDAAGASSNIATVTIAITAVNDNPVAKDDAFFVVKPGGAVMIAVTDLNCNDSDQEDGSPPGGGVVVLAGSSVNGTASLNTGVVTFTHDGSDTEFASFQYQAKDSEEALSNTATVSIKVALFYSGFEQNCAAP